MYRFNKSIAMVCGVNAALLAKFIEDSIDTDEKHEHDSKYWCRCSILMMTGHFPFLTRHMIADALERLVESKIIKKGCFNQNRFDHTNWYTFTDYGKLLLSKETNEKDLSNGERRK